MTETPNVTPPTYQAPDSAPPRQALRRRHDDRVLGGVCSGLARYLGVDPILVRVIVVVLALFGGGGILVYLAAWLLIPEEGREQSAAQQLVGSRSQTVIIVIVAVVVGLIVAPLVTGEWFGMGRGFGAPSLLLFLAAIALVVWLVRRDKQPPGSSTPTSAEVTSVTGPAWQHATTETAVLSAPPPELPPSPTRAATPRSVLGLLTISAAALAAGGLITVGLAVDGDAINATTVFGAALFVVGVGLLVGTFIGRSRGLLFLGVALTLATAASAVAPSIDLAGGMGERTWRPLTAADAAKGYQLGIGQATLDLRDLVIPATGLDAPISASVGVGEIIAYLPDDVDVEITASVGLGEIKIPGHPPVDGSDNELNTLVDVPDETATIALDLVAGLGQVTARRTPTGVPGLQQQGALR